MCRERERGTAALEAVLCLPFLFLILAAMVALGYAGLVRIHGLSGSRLATTHVNDELGLGRAESTSRARALGLVSRHVFPAEREDRSHRGSRASLTTSAQDVEGMGGLGGGILDTALTGSSGFFPDQRIDATMRVTRRPPTLSRLLQPSSVIIEESYDSHSWTFDEFKMLGKLERDPPIPLFPTKPVIKVIDWMARADPWVNDGLWVNGMVGRKGCK